MAVIAVNKVANVAGGFYGLKCCYLHSVMVLINFKADRLVLRKVGKPSRLKFGMNMLLAELVLSMDN